MVAILVAMVLLWMFPGLRNLSFGSGGDVLKSGALGLVLLLSLPMVALLVAITIIGLPFGFLTFIAWLAGLYLAKVVIGIVVGQMLMPDSESNVLPIVAGMAAITVVVNIPWLGGVVGFLYPHLANHQR